MKKSEKKKSKKGFKLSSKAVVVIVIIILLVFLVFAVFYSFKSLKEEERKLGVDDKGVKLVVYGWKDGKMVGKLSETKGNEEGELASLLEFGPPSTQYELDAISIEHTIVSPVDFSEVDVDVSDLQASFTTDGVGSLPGSGDSRYEDAISGLTQLFTLAPGDSIVEMSNQIFIEDLEDDCNEAPFCEFKLQAVASFEDVDPDTGLQTTTDVPLGESYGTVIIKVVPETCSDGTPFGECSLTAPGGKFCDGMDGLIDCADPTGCTPSNYPVTSCSCDEGYYESNGDAVCGSPFCDGGLAAGECLGTDALMCDPDCVSEECGSVILDCYECGQAGQDLGSPLGWLDAILNAAECPLAYNGDPASSCHEIQHTCKYKGKKVKIDVLVG